MKILMLGWELPPHNSGGLGVACYYLCKSLAKKGVSIDFLLPYTAQHDIDFMTIRSLHPQGVEEIKKSGIAYDSFEYVLENGKTENVSLHDQVRRYEKAVESISKIGEFDIIHAHDWLTCRAALRAKEISGKPLIVHFHSVESDRSGKHHGGNPLVREIESLALHIADRIIAVSNHTKQTIIREYQIPAEKIDVVHNSFDTDALIPHHGNDNEYAYLSQLKQQGYKIVANIGRLTIQKGISHLLQAFAATAERVPKSILLIVGSGEQYHELIKLSSELGIAKNVLFADFQRGKRYRDAYSIADVFVMPSVSEPFGLTPLEAIGYGTPTIISKQSGVSEILHHSLKFDYWDTDKLANYLVSVLQNQSLGEELHTNSYREFSQLSWDHSAAKLSAFYEEHHQGVLI
jgi:glycogen synthase